MIDGSGSAGRDVASEAAPFRFPPIYSYPPFFTRQRNATTRASQIGHWSQLIFAYCRHHHEWRLSIGDDLLASKLCYNRDRRRRISRDFFLEVIDDMVQRERLERIDAGKGKPWSEVRVWWRSKEEWASIIADWIEETGQKGSVLTLYELAQGDVVKHQEWAGMDEEMIQAALNVLVKNRKAQMFGTEGERGIKFF